MKTPHFETDNDGNIPSPFAYLNPDSKEWEGGDESDGSDGFDAGGGILAPYQPIPDGDGGGDEADLDDDEDEDDGDDTPSGFLVGIGLLIGNQCQPRFA